MIKRPVHRARFTKAGYEKLKKDYDALKATRPAAVEDLKKAREMGDLKENGYYKASRQKLNAIDANLVRMAYHLKFATIVPDSDLETIGIGSTVLFLINGKDKTYQFVGDLEANPSEGKLSLLSPIGRAVEGKKIGDAVEVKTPSGVILYSIKKIS
jgi:transcription elongation factor GreA